MGLGVLLLAIPSIAQQQYIIRYDLAREEIKYFRIKRTGDTTPVSVIDLSKTNRVKLQLTNTANSYRREIKYITREEEPETVIIPGMGSSTISSLTNAFPGISNKSLSVGDIFKKSEDKGFEILTENNEQKTAKLRFTSQYNAFMAAYTQWKQSRVFYEQNCKVLWKDLAGLRYSLQYPADEVRLTARKKMQAVFPEAADANYPVLAGNAPAGPQALAASAKSSFTEMANTYLSFKELEIKSGTADSLAKEAITAMTEISNNATAQTDEITTRITELYRQILSDSYTSLTPLEISRKTIMAEVQLMPVIDSVTASLLNMKGPDTIKRWISLYKKEPLRFRNTFGFSFVSFAENRWHYFVRSDSTIGRESADQYQPVIVTYLHFYAPRDRGFRWGGSLGVGVPLGGDNTKVNIMMGLSTFLGKGDPVCLTAGVSGTQVNKLLGIKTGDKVDFTELTNKNYQSVYRLGYFVAVTFNPGSLSQKD